LIDFDYHQENGTSHMNVAVTVPDAGYRIVWNDVVNNGSELFVDAEIWEWNGGSADVISTHYYTYPLGNLSVGEYVFTFRAWGEEYGEARMQADSIRFLVSPFDLTRDGYVGVDDIVLILEHFARSPFHSNWDPLFDMNEDDYIGIDDIVEVAQHFGESS
jgi:hypothetical protein